MLPTVLSTVALVLALVAAAFALYAMIYSRRCFEFVQQSNARSVTLKRLTEIETELTEQTDSIVAIQQSMRKLRGRLQARRLNSEKPEPTTSPEDPEEWKRRANLKLMQGD